MSFAYTPPVPAPRPAGADRYLAALGVVLLGYALTSRSFAYLGVPPVFVGEIMLGLGLTALVRVRARGWLVSEPALWLLGAMVALTAARTLPYVGRYALDAPRDAMQAGYALFAFVVAGLLVDRPERLRTLVLRYRVLAGAVLAVGWAVYLAVKLAYDALPDLPWAGGVKVLESKAGESLVHLAAITAFLYVGFMRRRAVWVALLALSVGLALPSSRGGMAAYGLGVAAAWALRPPTARAGRLAYAFVALLALGAVLGPTVAVNGGTREVSVEQLWQNVRSVFEPSGTSALDGSKAWRMLWWGDIWDYTVRGPYFWTGKGFGVNLAEADGYGVEADPPLRSPHNGHLTMLARAGVPGFLLWIGAHLAWLAAVLRAWAAARRRRQAAWMGFFALVVAYAVAALANGAFDVYFEGPMGGIWYWTVWGAGLPGAYLHPRHPRLLDGLLEGEAPVRPALRPAWTWTPSARAPVVAETGQPLVGHAA
jgi:hypothetical protein